MRMPLLFTGLLTQLASVVPKALQLAVVARGIFPGVLIVGVSARLGAAEAELDVGLAARDITPDAPIWLAGYAARKHPSEKVESPLMVQAVAFRAGDERVVLVSLDNCEISHAFIAPVVAELSGKHHLKPGALVVVSSHTHSAPVLEHTLTSMYNLSPEDQDRIRKYSGFLRTRLAQVVGAALDDLKPAGLEYAVGRATFAMNRRVYNGDKIDFGENSDGPVEWETPVLRVKGADGAIRGLLFGYGCQRM